MWAIPARSAWLGRGVGEVLALEPDRAARHLPQAGDRLRQLGLPVALHAGQGDDLPGPDGQGDVVDHGQAPVVLYGQVLELEDRSGPGAASGLLTTSSTERPTIIAASSASLLSCGRGVPHHLAEAHHGDAVGHGKDLFQLVGDEQDRAPRLGQGPDDLEEPLGLLGREDGGGLVQDQHLGVADQRLDDLHPLLGAHGQVLDQGVGLHVEAELPGQPADVGPGLARGRASPGAARARSPARCSRPR